MYMDDYIDSFPDNVIAIDTCSQLVNLLKSGQFELLKWVSNSLDFMSEITENLKRPESVTFDKSFLNVLGLKWDPYNHIFSFQIILKKLVIRREIFYR